MARSMGRADGRLITNGIVIINIVFRVCIAGCRRVPARLRICSSCTESSSAVSLSC
jgi:hypothetical protein